MTTLSFALSVWLLTVNLLHYFRPNLSPLVRVGYQILLGYLAVLISSLPFALANRWSFAAQNVLLAAAAGICLWRFGRFYWSRRLKPPAKAMALLITGCALGIGLQWNGIYHLYSTHDPSAYLNSALHLKHTGKFLHEHPIAKLAEKPGNESIKPLLHLESADEPWQLSRNYGLVPLDAAQGISSYHGFFAAPLFLAIGGEIFGEAQALRLQWIHFIAAVILGVALLQYWYGEKRIWPWLFAPLYALSPLIAPLFREPLSEPLATVFFLGAVLALFQWKRHRALSDLVLFSLCLGFSLCVRISSVLYIPFVLCALLVIQFEQPAARKALAVYLVSVLVSGLVTLRLSPKYASEILTFYSEVLVRKIPGGGTLLIIAAGLGLLLAWRFLRVGIEALHRRKVWTWGWRIYWAALGLALLFRYGKLVTRLDYYIGGYPFVLYNLDSLIFYASPAVALIGLFFWFRWAQRRCDNSLFFLQSFLPFAAFFYFAFRFLPLNLQPNFQRYLIIEFVPLCLVGFIFVVARARSYARLSLMTFTLCWCVYLLYSINHSDIDRQAMTAYQELEHKISSQNSKPVIVAVAPSWQDTAFLMPLMTGFTNLPVLSISRAFDFESSQALRTLEKAGYQPVLVATGEHPSLTENSLGEWKRFAQWNHCYDYPKFDLATPPMELSTRCATFSLMTRQEPTIALPGYRLAWAYRGQAFPIRARHWFGFEVGAGSACGKVVTAKFDFPPEQNFELPQVRINGREQSAFWAVVPLGNKRPGHLAELTLRAKDLHCEHANTIDVVMTQRQASVLAVEIKPESAEPSLISLLTLPSASTDK